VAQLDVFRTANGEYLVDFQSDLLDHLNTRFVIPLESLDKGPKVAERLNPIFTIEGERMALYTQFALTVPQADLQDRIASLAEQRYVIMDAFDLLISGY
jgi:toxin CcdB